MIRIDIGLHKKTITIGGRPYIVVYSGTEFFHIRSVIAMARRMRRQIRKFLIKGERRERELEDKLKRNIPKGYQQLSHEEVEEFFKSFNEDEEIKIKDLKLQEMTLDTIEHHLISVEKSMHTLVLFAVKHNLMKSGELAKSMRDVANHVKILVGMFLGTLENVDTDAKRAYVEAAGQFSLKGDLSMSKILSRLEMKDARTEKQEEADFDRLQNLFDHIESLVKKFRNQEDENELVAEVGKLIGFFNTYEDEIKRSLGYIYDMVHFVHIMFHHDFEHINKIKEMIKQMMGEGYSKEFGEKELEEFGLTDDEMHKALRIMIAKSEDMEDEAKKLLRMESGDEHKTES